MSTDTEHNNLARGSLRLARRPRKSKSQKRNYRASLLTSLSTAPGRSGEWSGEAESKQTEMPLQNR